MRRDRLSGVLRRATAWPIILAGTVIAAVSLPISNLGLWLHPTAETDWTGWHRFMEGVRQGIRERRSAKLRKKERRTRDGNG